MKKSLLISAMLIITFSLHAQTDQTYTETFDNAFRNVSRTQATTDILYERVVPFANLTNFNSNTGIWVDTSHSEHFMQAYSELYRAAFRPFTRLPLTPENFEKQVQNSATPAVVDIGLLHCNFNIMDSAVAKVKLSLNSNGLVQENSAVTASLYLRKTVFAAAPLSARAHGAISFRFNSSFNFDNTRTSLNLLRVDFGDGRGLRTVAMGSVVSVSYPHDGQKTLKFVASYSNGETFTAYATMDYTDMTVYADNGNASGWPHYKVDTIFAKIAYTNYYAGQAPSGVATGYTRTYYAHSDKILRKPILIVDGFDPGNGREVESDENISLWGMLYYTDNWNTKQHLAEQLLARGYDIVMLDLPDGGGYIERNAMVCIEVINELNRRLAASGSTEQLVVVGPSMGGQITRYALAYMEQNPNANTNNGNHNCRLWVSFDSPHQGANISMGAQAFLYFFGYTAEQNAAKSTWENTVCCVAAKQMLINHYDASSRFVFNTYYNNLRNMPNNGYPVNLRKVAVSNGNLEGITNGWGGRTVVELNTKPGGLNVATIRLSPDKGQQAEIFKGMYAYIPKWYEWVLKYGIFKFEYHKMSYATVNNSGKCSIDAAPGGTYSTFKTIINTVKGTKEIGQSLSWQDSHCFMPVTSVLDISGDSDYCTDFSNTNLVTEERTPFDAYWGNQDQQNMEHVSFNQDLVDWLMSEIEPYYIFGPEKICGSASGTFQIKNLPANASIKWEYSNKITALLVWPQNYSKLVVQKNASLPAGRIYTDSIVVKIKIPQADTIRLVKRFSVGSVPLASEIGTQNEGNLLNWVGFSPLMLGCEMHDAITYFGSVPEQGNPYDIVGGEWIGNNQVQVLGGDPFLRLPGIGKSLIGTYRCGNTPYVSVRLENRCGWSNATDITYYKGEECSGFDFFFSPNPTTDEITVEFQTLPTADGAMETYAVKLLDRAGTIQRQTKFDHHKGQQPQAVKFNTSSLQPGVYFLHVEGAGQRVREQIIVIP